MNIEVATGYKKRNYEMLKEKLNLNVIAHEGNDVYLN